MSVFIYVCMLQSNSLFSFKLENVVRSVSVQVSEATFYIFLIFSFTLNKTHRYRLGLMKTSVWTLRV